MEGTIKLHIEKLPEGLYLTTSEYAQGLVAQGTTTSERLEIARDVAQKLLEAQGTDSNNIQQLPDNFDYPLLIGM